MDKVFEALASTPRRKILAYLSEVDLTAGEIARRFDMSKPAISKHLQIDPDKVDVKMHRREAMSLLEIDIEIETPAKDTGESKSKGDVVRLEIAS